MKKILLLIVVTVLFSACNAILKPQVNSAVIDYKILSNHNIFASEANSVYFEYTPIGSFSFYAVGGYDETNIYKELNPCIYDVYAEIIKKAKDCNANGIINFKISIPPNTKAEFMFKDFHCELVPGVNELSLNE